MRLIGKIWWMPLIIYLIITPVLMSGMIATVPCRKIEVSVKDSSDYMFVTRERIFGMVQNEKYQVLGDESGKIELARIEEEISRLRELERAEVYNTIDGTLHVDADQRDPIVRVINRYGRSQYIDAGGMIIPHSEFFTPRVLVISGYIEIGNENLRLGNINSMDDNSLVKQLFALAGYVNDDDFWSAQIEQIWVNPRQELEMVPRAGNHIIKFGPAADYERKFHYLKTLYMDALPIIGWDSYREISLRYDGQIVCKRR